MNESGLITKYIHRRARQNIYIHLPIGEWGGGGEGGKGVGLGGEGVRGGGGGGGMAEGELGSPSRHEDCPFHLSYLNSLF